MVSKSTSVLLGAFCGFLTLGSLSALPSAFVWFCGFVLTVLLIFQWLFTSRLKPVLSRFLTVCQFVFAFLLTSSYANHVLHSQLAQRDFQPQRITSNVKVMDISQSVGERIRQVVQPVEPVDGLPEKWLISPSYKNRSHVTAELNQMRVGEVWQLEADIRPPHGVASKGVFSEQRWLLGLKVAGRAHVVDAKRVEQAQTTQLTWKERLANYRLGLRERISTLTDDETYAQDKAVLLGLLTGDRALINRQTKDTYQHMGISHLLAISGPHVLFAASMFAFVLIKLLNLFPRSYQWLPKRSWVLPSSLIVALGYALLAGWDLPAQRTVLMFAITVFLLLVGKRLSFWWVMLLSATVILVLDPLAVLSAAFWLSFVAVGLLVLLSQASLLKAVQTDELQQLGCQKNGLQNLPQAKSLKQKYRHRLKTFVLLQLVFFVAILPITLLFFGKTSWLTPFVNLIAIPLLGLVVVPLNIVAFLLDMMSPTLANMIWYVLLWVLHVFHGVVQWLQEAFPHALVGMHMDKTALWAFGLLLALWLLPTGKRLRLVSIPLVALLIMPRQLPAPAVMTVFDGTAFTASLVKVQKNSLWTTQHTMLYLSDIQADRNYQYELENHLLPSLVAHDVGRIDKLVVSVSDDDLQSDMVEPLMTRFSIASIVSNTDVSAMDNSFPDSTVTSCDSDMTWQWGKVSFDMLSPWADVPVSGDDAACTLRISVVQGQQPVADDKLNTVLLMGNATALTENMLLMLCDNVQADVLLLPRQGQQSGTQLSFLSAVKPTYAMTSVKQGDYRGLPHLQTRARLMLKNVTLDMMAERGTTTYYLGSNQKPFYERMRWPWLAAD